MGDSVSITQNGIETGDFDDGQLDTSTTQDLMDLLLDYRKNVENYAFNVGRILSEAKQLLAASGKYDYRVFEEWCKVELGCERATANRYMRYYVGIKENPEICSYGATDKPIEVIAALASNGTPEEVKDKIKSGEIKTSREMRRLRKQILQGERDNSLLRERVKSLEETKEKVIEKVPDDYGKMKLDLDIIKNQKLELDEKLRKLERENKKMKKKTKEHEDLLKSIKMLKKEKLSLTKQYDSLTLVGQLVKDVDILLGKVSPIKYGESVLHLYDNDVVRGRLSEMVGRVRSWCNDMDLFLEKGKDYFDITN